ncbi:MAG: dihydropyrimidinase, partial [Pseudomonadota bacterium]|nr:dihydropyrimidinase [Pseudomonadota bacterium]
AEEGVVLAKCGDGEFIAREPYPAVNKALSKWKEITSPRKVERKGIPAGV